MHFDMKLKFLSLAAGMLLTVSAAAQDNTLALPWSRIDHNPVTLGTATAGYADLGAAAWASFRNPAVLGLAPVTLDAAASWAGWMPSSDEGLLSHINAAAAYRFGKMGFAVGASYMPGKEYEVFTLTGETAVDDLRRGKKGFRFGRFHFRSGFLDGAGRGGKRQDC